MKKFLFILIFAIYLTPVKIYSNDGVFFMRGNQLIPMFESEISLKKEVLTIERIDDYKFKVKVEYDLFNPGN
ncbi:MAG TPA: hypothetical protein DIS94_04100, partial [Bacteroidetes bacterium]|nr:hypothetical protein [Bacteroidota bacterium]